MIAKDHEVAGAKCLVDRARCVGQEKAFNSERREDAYGERDLSRGEAFITVRTATDEKRLSVAESGHADSCSMAPNGDRRETGQFRRRQGPDDP